MVIASWTMMCVFLIGPVAAPADHPESTDTAWLISSESVQSTNPIGYNRAAFSWSSSAGTSPDGIRASGRANDAAAAAAQNSPNFPPNNGNKAPGPADNATASNEDACPESKESQYTDCRGVFYSSFYVGLAIDTFAGSDLLKYLDPGESGKIHERAVGGFDFAYRLIGDRMPAVKDGSEIEWHPKNLWVYGETVHGVRSADVNCTKNPDLPVCAKSLTPPSNPGEQLYYILRNATSLEGFVGLRWEFLGLQQKSSAPANVYVKAQAGFLSVAGAPGSAMNVDHVALGAIATKGNYEDSYLEVGFGRSDMFAIAPHTRTKLDAYLQRRLHLPYVKDRMSFFTQLTVDAHLGHGSDAIQTYIGFNFDLMKLFPGNKGGKSGGRN